MKLPIDTIVVPQGAEYQAVSRGLKQAKVKGIRVIAIPIGTKNISQTLANNSFQAHPTIHQNIVMMGLCGSLSPKYSPGHIVIYDRCKTTEEKSLNLSPELTSAVQQQLKTDVVIGLTCDRLIYRAQEKLQLGKKHQASVVDMEGYGYIQKLQQLKINCATIRVVSDDLPGDIPDLNQAIDTAGNLRTGALAIAFIQQPMAALRLIRGSLQALKVLQQVTYQLMLSTE